MQIHLYLLALWALLWVVFYGWGVIACRIARCDRDDALAILLNPWIGFACIIGVLQIWHFVAPITTLTCAVVCTVGILGAAAFNPSRLWLIVSATRAKPVLAAVVALLAVWLANRSLSPPNYTDHGLYYLNTIRWATEFPIVPGLSNLHNRLGFNNSHFLLHAMLESLTGRGHSAHMLNGLLSAMAVAIVVQGFWAALKGTGEDRYLGWFQLVLAMMVSTGAMDGRIYSATPDLPATLLVTISAWRLLAIGAIESESLGAKLRWNLLAIATLATVAVTLKSFVLFFNIFAGMALFAVIYRRNQGRDANALAATARAVLFSAVCSLLLFVPWVGRGYTLSGYPLFPSTFAGAPVEWKHDPGEAAKLRTTVRRWSRTYHMNFETGYDGWAWIAEWTVQVAILRTPVEVAAPAGLAVLCMIWLAWHSFLRTSARELPGARHGAAASQNSLAWFTSWLLAGAYLSAIACWFVLAPSPRFGSFALWGLAAVGVSMVARTLPDEFVTRYRRLLAALLVGLLLMPLADEAIRAEFRHRHKPDHFMYGKHFYHFYPFIWPESASQFPTVPKGETVSRITKSGLAVYLGAEQPDGLPGLLWDSPLPAARFFNPNLTLRRSGELQSGFKIVPDEGK